MPAPRVRGIVREKQSAQGWQMKGFPDRGGGGREVVCVNMDGELLTGDKLALASRRRKPGIPGVHGFPPTASGMNPRNSEIQRPISIRG